MFKLRCGEVTLNDKARNEEVRWQRFALTFLKDACAGTAMQDAICSTFWKISYVKKRSIVIKMAIAMPKTQPTMPLKFVPKCIQFELWLFCI